MKLFLVVARVFSGDLVFKRIIKADNQKQAVDNSLKCDKKYNRDKMWFAVRELCDV